MKRLMNLKFPFDRKMVLSCTVCISEASRKLLFVNDRLKLKKTPLMGMDAQRANL